MVGEDFVISKIFLGLLIFLPLAVIAWLFELSPIAVFLLSALAIVPLAKFMSEATDALAARTNPAVSGLLNATFGNATEIIIGIFAIRAGLVEVVKASITGSIIGNLLLVLGAALFAGGLRHKEQRFGIIGAQASTSLLTLACIALVMPAVFKQTSPGASDAIIGELSVLVSILMLFSYVAYLIFVLVTHKHLYTEEVGQYEASHGIWQAIIILLASTVGVAFMSEILVASIEPVAKSLGWTQMFIGVIFVAIIGNAAEHSSAVMMALRNKAELALQISVGSATQIAMFAAPLLVLLSFALGNPMDLIFSSFELVAIVFSVWIARNVVSDGKSNWIEGFMLLSTYLIMAVVFFFHP